MTRKLIAQRPTTAQIEAAAAAIAVAKAHLANLIRMNNAQKRQHRSMGERSEPFCHRAIAILATTPQLVPPSVDVAEAQADLDTFQQLRPLLFEVTSLQQGLTDTLHAAGAQALTVALQGYSYLKLAGRALGLEQYHRELSPRFAKRKPGRTEAA